MEQEYTSIELTAFPRVKPVEHLSPFRYPGGKTFLAGYLANAISALPAPQGATYVEPFCGGAGAALALLGQRKIIQVHLNDKDIRIYSAWRAILKENKRFLTALRDTPVTLDTWMRCRSILTDYDDDYSFDLGFATFFINRTSRAGIIQASGPIGGYDQKGAWKIDARYYKKTIERRIERIGTLAKQIKITNRDGLDFLKWCSKHLDRKSTLYFVDPPYVQAGSRLYYNDMNDKLHHELAHFLKSGNCKHWILTYDDDVLIRKLYYGIQIKHLPVNYSLRKIRKENELLIRNESYLTSDSD